MLASAPVFIVLLIMDLVSNSRVKKPINDI